MAKFAKHMQSFQVQPPSPSVSSLVPSDDVDSMQLLTNMSAILSPCLAGAAGTDDDHLAFITNIHNHAALCEPNHDLHSPLFHSRPSVPDLPATWVAEALPPVFDEQVFINMPTPLPDNHVRCSDQKRKVLQLSPESGSGIVSSSPPSPPPLGKKKKSDDPSTESLERGKRRKSIDKEENPKDVVHVRARRGQATDSHSLAERVRRGKINEKLRHLQAIVPGCYKAMGMASMLGEIINYVQSLQHQVEFLSMKLAAASLHHDFNSEQDDAMQAGQGAQSYYGDKELHVRLMMRHANFSSTLPNLDFTF